MASVGAAGFGPVDRNAVSDVRSGRYDQRPEAPAARERSRGVATDRRDNAAVAEGGQSPSTAAAADMVRSMRREMAGSAPTAGAGGIQRESRLDGRRIEPRGAARPAVATAAEDLRTRMTDESRRSAGAMTEAATQRALREYSRAG